MVVGLLGAASIVGLKSMTDGGNTISAISSTTVGSRPTTTVGAPGAAVNAAAARGACAAAASAAEAASSVFYVNSGGSYPVKWPDMTASTPPTFELSAQDRISPTKPAELDGPGWKLTMSGGGTLAATFTCS